MPRKTSGESVTKRSAQPRQTTATRQKRTRTVTATAKRVEQASILPCTEGQIRERAYFIYLERRGTVGNAVGDWLQAERESTRADRSARE